MQDHPEYKTADAGEKDFFKKQCKQVIPRLEAIKANLLKRYQIEYEVNTMNPSSMTNHFPSETAGIP